MGGALWVPQAGEPDWPRSKAQAVRSVMASGPGGLKLVSVPGGHWGAGSAAVELEGLPPGSRPATALAALAVASPSPSKALVVQEGRGSLHFCRLVCDGGAGGDRLHQQPHASDFG